MTVTVRFAPSPTGFLHIGGARTALFNWLFARHHGGAFRLRIEDTDRERSTKAAEEAIVDGLKWLGIEWDGEVVYQFSRAAHHAEIARQLLDAGHAYRCYCTPEELEAMRAKALAEKRSVRYDGTWRDRDPAEAPPGVAPAIRLKAERTGATVIRDHVLGEVTVGNGELDDLIILRSDGTPTYNFSVVVDDHDMGISHVIRGNEHFRNAFRQTQIYRALGWPEPEWAHIPLIHGSDGAKMSKRHGALGIDEYRKLGYLPEAIRNYLLRLGWSHGDDEIISTEQAIEWFDLPEVPADAPPSDIGHRELLTQPMADFPGIRGKRITGHFARSPAQFDFVKLNDVNAHYIRQADDARLVDLVVERLTPRLPVEFAYLFEKQYRQRLLDAMPALKPRAKTIVELAESAWFYIAPRPIRPINDLAAALLTEDAKQVLGQALSELADLSAESWSTPNLSARLRPLAERTVGNFGRLAQPLRVALTGSTTSPGIFEVMEVLGRDETLGRIEDAAKAK
ncbi:MAG TPA: glutamate--tRNA ligase [Stellaceae bacterium]|nr:glutamate--tRNA ligase [Stellaceae bacterium]